MELNAMLYASLDRRGFGREWMQVYVWLSPLAIHLKPQQH